MHELLQQKLLQRHLGRSKRLCIVRDGYCMAKALRTLAQRLRLRRRQPPRALKTPS